MSATEIVCGGRCVSATTDNANCGACRNACADGPGLLGVGAAHNVSLPAIQATAAAPVVAQSPAGAPHEPVKVRLVG